MEFRKQLFPSFRNPTCVVNSLLLKYELSFGLSIIIRVAAQFSEFNYMIGINDHRTNISLLKSIFITSHPHLEVLHTPMVSGKVLNVRRSIIVEVE